VRRRILIATTTVALAAIAVFGVPLALVAQRIVRDDALRRLDREADAILFAIDNDVERRAPVDAAAIGRALHPGRRAEVIDPAGRRTVMGSEIVGRKITAVVQAASGTRVLLTATAHDSDRRALAAVVVVGGLAAAGVVVAAVLASVVAGRLARPIAGLGQASQRLGAGDFSARAARSDIPEVDKAAVALNATAQRLEHLIEAERSFSANASHQLRTPLTALRLHVEELAASSDEETRRGADLALTEADRLERTIVDLLAFARRGRFGPGERVDVAALLRDRSPSWNTLFAGRHRRVVVTSDPACAAFGSSAALSQALDAVVDNSARYGRGTTTVTACTQRGHVEIAVSDEGNGIPTGAERDIFERHTSFAGGTGVGLALARSLVEADGGRLELQHPRPPTFRFLLPSDPPPGGPPR